MKKLLSFLFVLMFSLVLISPAAAQGDPTPTITFLNPPPGGVLELGVGESYTFHFQVASDQPFIHAQLGLIPNYPGKTIFSEGIQLAHQGTQASLDLTVTGKAVVDRIPDGQAPVTLVVGVRYQGGVIVAQSYEFVIVVK